MTLGLSDGLDYMWLPLDKLWLDEQNPRLTYPSNGQCEAIRSLAHIQGQKLYNLAVDIVEYGINPSDLPIVMPSDSDAGRYVVLDGNRGVAALQILQNPSTVNDVIAPRVMKAMVKLASQNFIPPGFMIQCVVVADRSHANHWIELRSTGERGGAGSVRWGADEIDRHRTRNGGQPNYASQVLEFLETRGDITPELRRTLATTSLTRICSTTEIRPKLGLDQSNGVLRAVGDIDEVAKALTYIVTEIAEQRLPVRAIYTKRDRMAYADKLPPEIVVSKTAEFEDAPLLASSPEPALPVQLQPRLVNLPPPRPCLIPEDCVLNVTDYRTRDIATELRTLKLSRHPNAVSVLFRVFLELSLDVYMKAHGLSPVDSSGEEERTRLDAKLTRTVNDLCAKNKLSPREATPVRRAANRDSLLGPSVKLMHQWVHNQHTSPTANDLRSYWNDVEPFIIALWSS